MCIVCSPLVQIRNLRRCLHKWLLFFPLNTFQNKFFSIFISKNKRVNLIRLENLSLENKNSGAATKNTSISIRIPYLCNYASNREPTFRLGQMKLDRVRISECLGRYAKPLLVACPCLVQV